MSEDTTATTNSPAPTPTTADDSHATSVQGGTDASAQPDTGDDSSDGGSILTKATGARDGNGRKDGDDGGSDGKGGDDQKDGDGEGDKGEDGPPEAYDLKIVTKAEDGSDSEVEIDKALLDKAAPLFKEVGLTNSQANKLAPLAVEVQNRIYQQQADNFDALKADWAKAAKADPELGKNWAETETLAAKALAAFVGPKEGMSEAQKTSRGEFMTLLDDSGLGNHPEMIRFCRAVGAAVGDDTLMARGDTPPPPRKSAEEIRYPNDVPKNQKQGA